MLGKNKCMIVDHNDMQIQGMCQNKYCKQPSRRICLQCIKDHQRNDQNFDISDIKSEQEIEQIINEFKYYNVDRMNNISLQCWIQQYLLNFELIEYIKLWNYKQNKIQEILEQLQQFNNNQWKQISLHNYLDNDKKNIGIFEYLKQYQQKLLYIDDLKDNYIKEIIKQKQYNDIHVNTEQNQFTIDKVETINKYNNQLFSNIRSNDLFKQRHQQNEEFIITICELILRQGYDLRTNEIYDRFQALNEKAFENQICKQRYLYIQSYAIAFKYYSDQSQRAIGLQLVNQSLDLKNNQAKALMIKGMFYFDDKNYDYAIKMYDEAIKIDHKYVDVYNNKGILFDDLEKYQEAIEMYDEAIKIYPKFAVAYNNKGVSLKNLQKYQEAIEMYDEAIKIDPKYANAYYNKANSLFILKQYQSSKASFQKYLKFYPNDDDTKQRIKQCNFFQISYPIFSCFKNFYNFQISDHLGFFLWIYVMLDYYLEFDSYSYLQWPVDIDDDSCDCNYII